jgi:hypothetical protein
MEGESIYALIPQPVPVPAKDPIYRSKHDGKKLPTFSTFGLAGTSKPGYQNVAGSGMAEGAGEGHHGFKKPFASMGKEGNARAPNEILMRGSGGGGGAADAAASLQGGFKYSDKLRPPVPTAAECMEATKAISHGGETKNFITSNAVENILAVPKRDPEAIDWLKKPYFGQTPPYLNKIKQEISDEYEYIKAMQQQQDDGIPAGMRQMADDERTQLVNSLKAKWDAVNKQYQQSSVLSLASLDTIGKVKRKEMYEAQLAQIEKDIEKLSKKVVYVAEDY